MTVDADRSVARRTAVEPPGGIAGTPTGPTFSLVNDTERGRRTDVTTLIEPVTTAAGAQDTAVTGRLMTRLGGAGLIAGSALFLAGFVTSPSQASESMADYIVALGRDPLLTQWSALLLHYANLLLGAAALLLPFLVRGRRGRGLTVAGALLMALGFLNTSGALISDWWIMEAAHRLPPEGAESLALAVLGAPLLAAWTGVQDIALIGVVVSLAGLARAGVVRWWLVPAPLVAFATAFVIPLSMPLLVSAVLGFAFAPLAWLGVLAIRRAGVTA